MAATSQNAPSVELKRKHIQVRGIVQGVGFRPFIYGLAHRLNLAGHVLNTSEGVLIEIEGGAPEVDRFLANLRSGAPPLAQIDDVVVADTEARGETGFAIQESVDEADKFALVSPDVATCDDCHREFTDPQNRRYGYPFTNCTNCGPRYTIVQNVPYDRPMTTMARFRMCPACQREYDDPADRRFHAQPNACPECGPSLELVSRPGKGSEGAPDLEAATFAPGGESLRSIREVRRLLGEGKIVAIKGLGGFHLACDAQNDVAVRDLRFRKRRSDKPFAVMAPNLAAVETICTVSDADRRALLDVRRPIVILPSRPGTRISPAVAPRHNTLGVMLPYSPLHHLLFADSPQEAPAFTALVMTSGNLSEEPIVSRNQDAGPRLGPLADWLLLHNRDIYMRVDDSVVRMIEGQERVLRRSRGFVPQPIELGADLTEMLACGGQLKNTFCLTKGRYAILSQHIGDLENYESLVFFLETLENLKRLFRVEPRAVAYDLHPEYLSTKYARRLEGLEKIGVQHHHAHVASCMAENGLREKVIGVALDGTGYGTDGRIWGGEFLVADFAAFERRAHLRYVPLPGGDAAIRQPWRSALSYLRETFGAKPVLGDLPWLGEIPAKNLRVVQAMLERGINTVDTSSCGRLFDAVASIIGLRQEINFEGQAAIELEMAAADGLEGTYPFDIKGNDPWQVDVRPTIAAIVSEVRRGIQAGQIAARFHNTLAAAIIEICARIRRADRLSRVCLSGGTFQNMFLLRRTLAGLRSSGFEVFTHARVPPNDGGISLGQAFIANQILSRGH